MILISASGLGRQYAGDPVFLDLALEVRAGERIGLVGPNGAGKTTLMKLLDGLEQRSTVRFTSGRESGSAYCGNSPNSIRMRP